mgnify:CR=1 FL=1
MGPVAGKSWRENHRLQRGGVPAAPQARLRETVSARADKGREIVGLGLIRFLRKSLPAPAPPGIGCSEAGPRGRFWRAAEGYVLVRARRSTRRVPLRPIKAIWGVEPALEIGRGRRAEDLFSAIRLFILPRAVCMLFTRFREIFRDLRVICRPVCR